jgi:hypothetical protein
LGRALVSVVIAQNVIVVKTHCASIQGEQKADERGRYQVARRAADAA